ncbi:MAG TPA: Ig-like domain-containing protein [Polyangia bacterium]|nr:Ig-like domain-containing protein [Polyangia bacterium]
MRALVVLSSLLVAACITQRVQVEVEVHEGGGHRPPPPPPPTCQDGVRNGDETGVDCGGPVCQPCPDDCGSRLILAAMTPTAGPVGTAVDLVGVGFRSVTELELNGAPVPFTADNDNHIVFQVPAGVSSGAVTLTAPCGSIVSPADFSVLRLRSVATIASSTNPSIAGRPVTFAATVRSSLPSPATPTGTVYFRAGDEILAAVTLADGTASATITLPAPGDYALTAEYSGDVDFEPSASPELQQTVNEDVPAIVSVPGVYDPTGSGTVFSAWLPGVGLNGAGDTSAQGLLLRKDTSTGTPVAALVDVEGVEGLDSCSLELGFDYFLQGHCGAGAPRFSLRTEGGVYFFGCRYGEHSSSAPGWGRVRFSRQDAIPEMTTCSPIVRLRIVMDEGTDTPPNDTVITPGFAILDNLWLKFGGREVVVGGPDPAH